MTNDARISKATKVNQHSKTRRILGLERLETRSLLTAAGLAMQFVSDCQPTDDLVSDAAELSSQSEQSTDDARDEQRQPGSGSAQNGQSEQEQSERGRSGREQSGHDKSGPRDDGGLRGEGEADPVGSESPQTDNGQPLNPTPAGEGEATTGASAGAGQQGSVAGPFRQNQIAGPQLPNISAGDPNTTVFTIPSPTQSQPSNVSPGSEEALPNGSANLYDSYDANDPGLQLSERSSSQVFDLHELESDFDQVRSGDILLGNTGTVNFGTDLLRDENLAKDRFDDLQDLLFRLDPSPFDEAALPQTDSAIEALGDVETRNFETEVLDRAALQNALRETHAQAMDDGLIALELPEDLLPLRPGSEQLAKSMPPKTWAVRVGLSRPCAIATAAGSATVSQDHQQAQMAVRSESSKEEKSSQYTPVAAFASAAFGAIFVRLKQRKRERKLRQESFERLH